MSKRHPSKRDGQKRHAIQRSKERYNHDLTGSDLEKIVKKIRLGQSKFITAKTLRVTIHSVNYQDVSYIVAYDKKRKSICTFLPQGAIK